MNYATGYGIIPKELYITYKTEKIDTKRTRSIEFNKKKICGRVFTYAMLQILNDIIDNNITFQLPVSTEAYIEMQSITGEFFKKARQNGAFEDINLATSHFTGNSLQFRARRKEYWKIKTIKVSKVLKNRIIENTNNGKCYN